MDNDVVVFAQVMTVILASAAAATIHSLSLSAPGMTSEPCQGVQSARTDVILAPTSIPSACLDSL